MTSVGGAPTEMVLEEMDRDESLGLLRTQPIGRLAIPDHGHYPPHIVPVNFVVDGEAVVFRSDVGLKFKLSILAEHSVSFEVDSVDPEGRMAWSVVVQGTVDEITDSDTWFAESLRNEAARTWIRGPADHYLRITASKVSGRLLPAPP